MTGRTPPDAEAVVAALTREGWSAPAIAARVGVTPRTVARIRVRMGVARQPPTPVPPQTYARAASMLADGASHVEVARTLGVSTRWLSKRFPGTAATRAAQNELLQLRRQARQLGL